MADDLINALRHCAECDHQGCAADCRFGKEHSLNFICIEYLQREAADAIEELSVVVRAQKAVLDKFPRWIPVTERLPEHSGDYLVYSVGGNWKQLSAVEIGFWYDMRFIVQSLFDVTHWMPLPEPPEKESKS